MTAGARAHGGDARWNRHADLWICLAIIAATVALYSQVRHFDFIVLDDIEAVSGNPHLKAGISPAGIAWAFASGEGANWFPLTRLSYLLEYSLFGLESGAYHLTNLVLHAATSVVLFLFLLRAANERWPSAFVAFLFALHPLHVESVAWVAERKDVLCALFWFLTLWAWVRYTERPARQSYVPTLFLFALGLMSKPMIITLPLVLLLLDVWPLGRKFSRQSIMEKLPFFALSAVSAVITFLVQRNGGAVQSAARFPLVLRIENALISSIVYIAKTFWPAGLAVPYPYPKQIPLWQAAAAGMALACVSALVLRCLSARPYLAVGWFWFLGTLVPVIGLIQVGVQARADRYMYVPMVGLGIMVAWGALDVLRHWPRTRPAVLALAAGVLLALVPVAWIQLGYWKNGETLFRHSIDVDNGNREAYSQLGGTLSAVPGRLDDAVAAYQAGLRIDPNDKQLQTDLGGVLVALNDPANLPVALGHFKAALRIDPRYAPAHSDLALALLNMGRSAEALEEARTAVDLKPGSAKSRQILGSALFMLDRYDEAIEQFREALRIQPDYAEAHTNLGVAMERTSPEPYSALFEFEEALRIQPDYRPAHVNLATALAQLPDRRPEAIYHLRIALRMQPDPALQKLLDELEAGQAPRGQ